MKNIYPRPKCLSDPFGDFSEEELASIIKKADGYLAEYDFMCIFQPRLPAGTYEENAYFISAFFNYADVNDVCPDLIENFIRWCSAYRDELRNDGLDVQIKLELMRLFKKKTEIFRLVVRKGKICPLPEYVGFVEGLIEGMPDSGMDGWNAQEFISQLFPCTSYERAGWLFSIFVRSYSSVESPEFFSLDVSNDVLAECSSWLFCALFSRKDELLFPYMKHAVSWPDWDWKRKNMMSCLVALFESRDMPQFMNDVYTEIPGSLLEKMQVVLEHEEEEPVDRLLVQDIVLGLLSLD